MGCLKFISAAQFQLAFEHPQAQDAFPTNKLRENVFAAINGSFQSFRFINGKLKPSSLNSNTIYTDPITSFLSPDQIHLIPWSRIRIFHRIHIRDPPVSTSIGHVWMP